MNIHPEIISFMNQITPERLTKILREAGFLEHGQVVKGQKKIQEVTLVSYIISIELTCAGVISPDLPKKLLLKVSKPRLEQIDNQREAMFYQLVAPKLDRGLTPLCFEGGYDPESGMSWILMEDLQESHFNLHQNYPLMPTLEQFRRTVEKLAEYHAFWWKNPLLQTQPFQMAEKEQVLGKRNELVQIYQMFTTEMQEWFTGPKRQVYEQVLENLDLLAREEGQGNHTLIHGDAHLGNVLYPKAGQGQVTLLDWADWGKGKAMDDLAYMVAFRYFPDQRRLIEEKLLQVHQQVLHQAGIDYSFEESVRDYKMAVIKNLLVPIYQWHFQMPENIWYYNLERAVGAFHDLNCQELL